MKHQLDESRSKKSPQALAGFLLANVHSGSIPTQKFPLKFLQTQFDLTRVVLPARYSGTRTARNLYQRAMPGRFLHRLSRGQHAAYSTCETGLEAMPVRVPWPLPALVLLSESIAGFSVGAEQDFPPIKGISVYPVRFRYLGLRGHRGEVFTVVPLLQPAGSGACTGAGDFYPISSVNVRPDIGKQKPLRFCSPRRNRVAIEGREQKLKGSSA